MENGVYIGETGEGRGFYMGAEMKGQIDEKDVVECARKLLKNTNPYLGQILDDVITNGNSSDAYLVIEKIAKDGYDISDFGLNEVPVPEVYGFANKKKKQYFDVYLECINGGDEQITIGYIGDNACYHNAENIKDAIAKFCFSEEDYEI